MTGTPSGPGNRGWSGPYGGGGGLIVPTKEWRASTVQACGLWPFGVSTALPVVGVPLGYHLYSGTTVCADPISWFAHARLIANPSMLIIARPGLGKSSLIRRMTIGCAAFGVTAMIAGDLKGEHVATVRALGGNVLELGRGRGSLNVLDWSSARAAAEQLTGRERARLVENAHGRRLMMLSSLVRVNRTSPPSELEMTVLGQALRVLDDTFPAGRQATIRDLIAVLESAPPSIRALTLDRGADERYRDVIDPLVISLTAMIEGALGDVFAGETTAPIDATQSMCVDISGIPESDEQLTAAVLLACWSETFGSIEAHQALVDAGKATPRNWLLVLDELWRILRAGSGMVERVDALTRLDRAKGVGMVMATHTVRDGAAGLAERIGYYGVGGVAHAELPAVAELVELTAAERGLITQWSAPESWDRDRRQEAPGIGKVLLKVGSRPGIPVQVQLTHGERMVGDTNYRWEAARYTQGAAQ